MDKNKTKIEISSWTIIKTLLIIAAFVFFWFIRDILLMLFVVLIIVSVVSPMADYLEKLKIPRSWALGIIYLLIAGFFALLIYLIVPPLIAQTKSLAVNVPSYINSATNFYHKFYKETVDWQNIFNSISGALSSVGQSFLSVTFSIFGGIASAITIIVLSFYLALESKSAGKFALSFIPEKNKESWSKIGQQIINKIGGWLRGQVVLCLVIGLFDFLALTIIGTPYALTLGVLGMLLEIVPIVGPLVAGVAAVLVTIATAGWIKAIIVAAVYILIQQLENHILVPKIMQKSVGLSPVVILIALIIGAKLAGIAGAILAIPIIAAISVIFMEYKKIRFHN